MILKEAVLAIQDRREDYEDAANYYEGSIGEVFATRDLQRLYRQSGAKGHLNFCRPVVDAVHNRLEISAVLGTSESANKIIGDTWELNQLGLDADEIHRRALVYGDCYVMVWPDEDGNMEISYNTPLTTSIVYDPESPKKKLYAVKMWETEKGTRMNIYRAETIEKYYVQSKNPTEGTNWNKIDTVDNEFGEVPVFHFRTERPWGRPEHVDAYDAQDFINKQFVTSMLVTDYQATTQRYALTRDGSHGNEADDFGDGDTARENAGALQNGPGKLWILDNIEKVGEFSAADPNVFWEPIKDTVRSMASLTNTPLHYFEKTGNVPSGEALRVAEAPLIKKVDRRRASFGQTWREVFKFVLKANNIDEDVQIKWVEVESLDQLERLDSALKKSTLGVSFEQILRELGYDEKIIELIKQEKLANIQEGQVSSYPNGEPVSNDQTNAMEVENNGN